MKIAVNETDGLARRLEMLSTTESADCSNTSVFLTREPCRPPAPPTLTLKQSPVSHEIDQERRLKFRQIEHNSVALRTLRAQRLEMLVAEAETKAKAEEAARLLRLQEEERIARERAAERERAEKERLEAEKKAEEERLAAEKKEKERQAAVLAAAERVAAEKAKEEKELADKQAAERALKEKQAKEKQEADKRAAEAAAAAAAAKAQANAASTAGVAASEYAEHMKVIEYAKSTLNPQVSANKPLKKECFDLKIKIKSKLGQLTPSKKHLMECVEFVKACFTQAQNLGDLGYDWVLNQYSKMVVQQAERESGANGASAVPIAMLTTLIWTAHPKLGNYLLARFVKRDPYVIGYQCSIDTEQGRKRMGYRRDDDNWEGEVSYAERIGGITSVWAVISQAKINAQAGCEHPYPITHSWVFLARQANLPTDTLYNGNFAAVAAWWDVAGTRFLTAFGHQGTKLLDLLSTTWPSSVDQKGYAASKRLALLGKDWKKNGKIEPIWKPLAP